MHDKGLLTEYILNKVHLYRHGWHVRGKFLPTENRHGATLALYSKRLLLKALLWFSDLNIHIIFPILFWRFVSYFVFFFNFLTQHNNYYRPNLYKPQQYQQTVWDVQQQFVFQQNPRITVMLALFQVKHTLSIIQLLIQNSPYKLILSYYYYITIISCLIIYMFHIWTLNFKGWGATQARSTGQLREAVVNIFSEDYCTTHSKFGQGGNPEVIYVNREIC